MQAHVTEGVGGIFGDADIVDAEGRPKPARKRKGTAKKPSRKWAGTTSTRRSAPHDVGALQAMERPQWRHIAKGSTHVVALTGANKPRRVLKKG